MYLGGAGLVVFLSFAVSALHLYGERRRTVSGHIDMAATGPVLQALGRGLRYLAVGLGLAVFALILATAFLGDDSPTRNFAPTFVWVIWWVGLVYVAALVADLWPWLNPWRPIALAVERLARSRLAPLPYPEALGCWPAVALFFAFAWIELVFDGAEAPGTLGRLIVAYSLLTAFGAALFGARTWLAAGEVFTVFFAVVGRFAPLHFHCNGLRLRVFAQGLLVRGDVSASLMVFVVLVLSTVTFDGFTETPAWSGLLDWVSRDPLLRPLLVSLRGAGVDLLAAVKSFALLVFPLLFLAVYLLVCRLTAAITGEALPTLAVARAFVFSLVPIAIAYHVAHYYSFLLLAGQLILPLLSDPFGYGWDLFGTAQRTIDITVVNAKTTWYVAVSAIVLGHVFAVWIGHLTALRLYPSRRTVLLSQIPMTALMVAYTMVSLWILSQPIVAGPSL
jgi:hypothetical protein